jgi:transcriptional regulator with XRE-family HTH domain
MMYLILCRRPPMSFDYVGPTILAIRQRRGISQAELGRRTAMGRGQLSHYERGRAGLTLRSLEKILRVLDVAPDEFFRLAASLKPAAGPRGPRRLEKRSVSDALQDLRRAVDRLERAVEGS